MDCKRINVLIGKPNVGKSNILEALSLYIAPYCASNKKLLQDYIRYEKFSNLFYDQDRKNQISVIFNIGFAAMHFEMNSINQYAIMLGPDKNVLKEMNETTQDLSYNMEYLGKLLLELSTDNLPSNNYKNITPPFFAVVNDSSILSNNHEYFRKQSSGYDTPIKKYHFTTLAKHESHFPSFLYPPNGNNLYTILESTPKLFDECTHFFNEYGLELLVDTEYEKIDVQKKLGNRVYKIPYSLAADTLQRIIFHLAAIETNNDSILLLEEPENHSFPPYISMLAHKIIENKENQYFIATHSPYLLTPFIEECALDEINIFISTYENYETKVRALTKEEIQNIIDTGIDLFYNISAFQK